MKAIVSLKNADESYPEVGMTNRTILSASSLRGLNQKIKRFVNKRQYRAEIYFNDKIYRDPDKIEYK